MEFSNLLLHKKRQRNAGVSMCFGAADLEEFTFSHQLLHKMLWTMSIL